MNRVKQFILNIKVYFDTVASHKFLRNYVYDSYFDVYESCMKRQVMPTCANDLKADLRDLFNVISYQCNDAFIGTHHH